MLAEYVTQLPILVWGLQDGIQSAFISMLLNYQSLLGDYKRAFNLYQYFKTFRYITTSAQMLSAQKTLSYM